MAVNFTGCGFGSLIGLPGSDSNVETVDEKELSEAEQIAVEYAKGYIRNDKEIMDKYYYYSNKDYCQAKMIKYDDMNSEMDFLKHEERIITLDITKSYDEVEPPYPVNSWDDYYSYYRDKYMVTLTEEFGDNFDTEIGVVTPREEKWPEEMFDTFIKEIESDELKTLVLDTSLYDETTAVHVHLTILCKGSEYKERTTLQCFLIKYNGVWKIVDAYA